MTGKENQGQFFLEFDFEYRVDELPGRGYSYLSAPASPAVAPASLTTTLFGQALPPTGLNASELVIL